MLDDFTAISIEGHSLQMTQSGLEFLAFYVVSPPDDIFIKKFRQNNFKQSKNVCFLIRAGLQFVCGKKFPSNNPYQRQETVCFVIISLQ